MASHLIKSDESRKFSFETTTILNPYFYEVKHIFNSFPNLINDKKII